MKGRNVSPLTETADGSCSNTFGDSSFDTLPAQFDTFLDLVKKIRSLNFQVFARTGEDVFYTCPFRRADPGGKGFVGKIVAIHARPIREFLYRYIPRVHASRGMIKWVRCCRAILQHVLNNRWWGGLFIPLRAAKCICQCMHALNGRNHADLTRWTASMSEHIPLINPSATQAMPPGSSFTSIECLDNAPALVHLHRCFF